MSSSGGIGAGSGGAVEAIPEHLRVLVAETDAPFDIDKFVDDFMRKPDSVVNPQAALKALRRDIEQAKSGLRNRLVDLLNSKFKEFVGLPAKLEGTSTSASGLLRDVEAVRIQVNRAHNAVGAVASKYEQAQERRAAVRSQLDKLQILRLITETQSTLPRLLDQASLSSGSDNGSDDAAAAAGGGDGDNLEAQYTRVLASEVGVQSTDQGSAAWALERAARALTLQSVLIEKANGFRIAANAQKGLASLSDRFDSVAASTFLQSIRAASRKTDAKSDDAEGKLDTKRDSGTTTCRNEAQIDDIVCCLRAYAFADREPAAEQLLRARVVRPLLEQNLGPKAFSRASSGEMLSAALRQAVQAVRDAVGPVLRAARFPMTGYNFVGNSIAPEFYTVIESRGGSGLFAAYSDRFLPNYRAVRTLLDELSELCPDAARERAFATSLARAKFEEKFKLSIYFQLRFQECRKSVEELVGKPPEAEPTRADTEPGLALAVSRAAWMGVARCWADNVWIDRLTHRFFKGTIQLLRLYTVWVSEGLGLASADGAPESKGTTPKSPGDRGNWTPTPAAPSLLALLGDIAEMERRVSGALTGWILKRIASASSAPRSEAKGLVSKGLQRVRRDLEAARVGCIRKMAGSVAQECARALGAVAKIKFKYSMTGSPPPTEPSPFVKSVLKPLQVCVATARGLDRTMHTPSKGESRGDSQSGGGSLPTRVDLGALVAQVGSLVTTRYEKAVSDLLQDNAKTEAVLSRLQKKRSVNKDSVSDADKIRLQLYLDVRAYRKQLEALSQGVGWDLARTTERLEALVKLPDRVSRLASA